MFHAEAGGCTDLADQGPCSGPPRDPSMEPPRFRYDPGGDPRPDPHAAAWGNDEGQAGAFLLPSAPGAWR